MNCIIFLFESLKTAIIQMQATIVAIQKISLPFLNQIALLRKKHRYYSQLVNAVEIFFYVAYLLGHVKLYADEHLSVFSDFMENQVIGQFVIVNIFSYLALFQVILFILVVIYLCVNGECGFGKAWKSSNNLKIMELICFVYCILQIAVTPGFLVTLYNIDNADYPQLTFINMLSLPFLIAFIAVERNRRIFHQYIIVIGILDLIVSDQLLVITITSIAIYLAFEETSLLKKVVYCSVIWLEFDLAVAIFANVEMDLYYFCVINFQVIAIVMFTFNENELKTSVQQNDLLLDFIQKTDAYMNSKKSFQLQISQILNKFKSSLTKEEMSCLVIEDLQLLQIQYDHTIKQSLKKFLMFKISHQISRCKDIEFQIQKIECILLTEPFSIKLLYLIQSLNKEIQKSNSLDNRLRIHNVIQKIQNKYLKRQERVNASVVINVQRSIQQFYCGIAEMIQIMMDFWTEKIQNNLTVSQMKTLVNRLHWLQDQLKQIIANIQQIRQVKTEIQVYNYVMKLINNSYIEIPLSEDKKIDIQNYQNLMNTNFILIENEQIVDISNQIVNEMMLDKKDMIEMNKDNLFPLEIKKYIDWYSNSVVGAEISLKNIILPLLVGYKSGYIKPHRCRFEIFPNLLEGIKYIIHFFASDDLQLKPTILYNPKYDSILYTSSNFFQYFDINKQLFLGQSFSQQIFGVDIGQTLRERVNSTDMPIHCTMNLKKICNNEKASKKSRGMYVQIKSLQEYNIENENLLLMEVKKKQLLSESFSKHEGTFINFFTRKELEFKEQTNHQYDHIGTTFCKIQNPFENMIEEKMSKIKSSTKISYLKLTLLGLFLAILLFGLMLVLLMFQINTNSGDLSRCYSNNNKKGVDTSQILTLLYKYYNYYHLVNYPQSLTNINPNINVSQLQKNYFNQIKSAIPVLLEAIVKTNPINSPATYKLDFPAYSVVSPTQTLNFIDYIQNIQLALSNNNPQFLVINEQGIHIILNNFVNEQEDQIDQLIMYYEYLVIGFLALVIFDFLVLKIIVWKIKEINANVLNLYSTIGKQYSISTYQKLKQFCLILEDSNYYKGVRQNKKDQVQEHSISVKQLPGKRVSLELLDGAESNISLGEGSQIRSIKQKVVNARQKSNSKNEEIILLKQSPSDNWIKQNLTILVPFFFLAFLLVNLYYLNQYQLEFANIFKTSTNIQQALNFIDRKAEDFYQSGMEQILPLSEQGKWYIDQNKTLITHIIQTLPQFYDGFINIKNSKLNSDICAQINQINSSWLTESFDCRQILGGILSTGFATSTELYLQQIDAYGSTFLRDYGSTYRIGAAYPVFIQICYVRDVLTDILSSLHDNFNDVTASYILIWTQFLLLILQIALCAFPFILLFMYQYYSAISEQCTFGLKIFILIPRSYLLKMSTTKILKKTQIMDRIQWLAI